MKTLLSLVVAAWIAATPLLAVTPFEGKIKMKLTTDERSQDMNYSVKGSRLRFDIDADGKNMASIMDTDKREILVMMPEQKMYMVMPIKEAADAVAAHSEDTTLEKTDITETILGYKTTKYLAKSKDSKEPVEIWAAEGIGFYFNPNSMGQKASKRAAPAWEKELRDKGFFPLRVVSKGRKKKEDFKMEVTGIEKASLPESLFVPPADYTKFEMPGFGNMLKGVLKP